MLCFLALGPWILAVYTSFTYMDVVLAVTQGGGRGQIPSQGLYCCHLLYTHIVSQSPIINHDVHLPSANISTSQSLYTVSIPEGHLHAAPLPANYTFSSQELHGNYILFFSLFSRSIILSRAHKSGQVYFCHTSLASPSVCSPTLSANWPM